MPDDPNQWPGIEPTPDYPVPGAPAAPTVPGTYTPPPWPGSKPGQKPPAGQPAAGPPGSPGSDVYDWYTVNDALRAAGFGDGNWQIAGASHSPVNNGKWLANTGYKEPPPGTTGQDLTDWNEAFNQGQEKYTWQQGNEWTIGIVNPTTKQMFKLTLGRQGDPKTGYAWSITDRQDQGKIEPAQGGYKEITRLPFQDGREEVWGVNTATGAFEKMPNTPTGLGSTKGWSDVKLQPDGQGNMAWLGTNPAGLPLQPVPNAPPPIKADRYVPGSIRQVTRGGKQIYVGLNPTTQGWEDIPELGSEVVVPPTVSGPGGTVIYQPDANGNLRPAPNVAQPQEGVSTRWVDAGGGRAKQQTFRNGQWADDVDVVWKIVDPTTARAEGAIKPKGQRYEELINGYLVEVEADGNGGYTFPANTKARRVPGSTEPIPQATSNDQEFIVYRDPSDPSGVKTITQRNPNWQPKASADQLRRLTDLANAKQAELHAKISATYTADQAEADFNTWWDSTVEPQKLQLKRLQDQENQEAQISAAQENRARDTQQANLLTSGQNYGQALVNNYVSQQKNMVGPGYLDWASKMSQAINTGGAAPEIDAKSWQYQGYDVGDLMKYGVAQYLQHVSPTAAAIANGSQQPAYLQAAVAGVDPNQILQRSAFQPQALVRPAAPAPAPGPAPAPATAAPATVTVTVGGTAPTASTQPVDPLSNLAPFRRGPLTG